MNLQKAKTAWAADKRHFEDRGAYFPMVQAYIPEGYGRNSRLALDELAMDANFQPALSTDPNSAVPSMLTTFIDPQVFKVLFAPNMAAQIFGEERKGDWLMDTAMFPVVEHVGEVSSYGDYTGNGMVGVNTNWPQRQAYLFQTVQDYGERELERAGLARINYVSELNISAATLLNKFTNVTYFFGVKGLQNYGLLNDPNLTAALTPATKAAGGTGWFNSSGQPNATANEVYNDILTLYGQLVTQNGGLVDQKSQLVLAMSPSSAVALSFTNSFNVNVMDLLKKNFPSMRIESAVQYGALTSSNPQGLAAGNEMQMFAESVEGQDVGYCAFNEKMRAHPIVRDLSSFRQKITAGTWGAIIRYAAGIAQMVGI